MARMAVEVSTSMAQERGPARFVSARTSGPSPVDAPRLQVDTVHLRQNRIWESAAVADGNITKDAMYGAVAPDDFESMLQLDRYGQRSDAFDKIIAATHDHFWDPLDKRYIDFDSPWDMENEPLTPLEMNPMLSLPSV